MIRCTSHVGFMPPGKAVNLIRALKVEELVHLLRSGS
jgi:hypothetical protein